MLFDRFFDILQKVVTLINGFQKVTQYFELRHQASTCSNIYQIQTGSIEERRQCQ